MTLTDTLPRPPPPQETTLAMAAVEAGLSAWCCYMASGALDHFLQRNAGKKAGALQAFLSGHPPTHPRLSPRPLYSGSKGMGMRMGSQGRLLKAWLSCSSLLPPPVQLQEGATEVVAVVSSAAAQEGKPLQHLLTPSPGQAEGNQLLHPATPERDLTVHCGGGGGGELGLPVCPNSLPSLTSLYSG